MIYLYFKYLYNLVINKFSSEFDVSKSIKAVLTVPSYFNDFQRSLIQHQASSSGFDIIRLINEPTAAAFAYGLDTFRSDECDDSDENIIVFDIGGGTLDISLLELSDNSYFEVVDSFGFTDLGGNNFTDKIYDHVIESNQIGMNTKDHIHKVNDKRPDSIRSESGEYAKRSDTLWKKCNNAKEKINFLKRTDIKIDNDHTFELNNNNCKEICFSLLEKIRKENWINDIKSKINDGSISISKIIMVGGSSKLIFIQELVEELFGMKPLVHDKLQHVVSLGACYYGAFLTDKLNNVQDLILIDTLPLSLGVETADGNFSVIIPKNTPLPVNRSQKYTTDTPGDEEVNIKVYQGEKNVAKNNSLIGEFTFQKVSKSTNPVININFNVNLDGIISVLVEDTKTKESKNILIKCDFEKDRSDALYCMDSADFLDDEEAKFLELRYRIRSKIENLLTNKSVTSSKVEEQINFYGKIIDELEKYNIPDLVKIDKELDEKFLVIINNSGNIENDSDTNQNSMGIDSIHGDSMKSHSIDSKHLEISSIIIDEKVNNLNEKLDFYLTKDLDKFKKDCLLEITKQFENILESKSSELVSYENNESYYKSISEFIDEKLDYIKELFSEDSKYELLELCNFLKIGMNNNEIPFDEKLYEILELNIKECSTDKEEIQNSYFMEQINVINSMCEKLI